MMLIGNLVPAAQYAHPALTIKPAKMPVTSHGKDDRRLFIELRVAAQERWKSAAVEELRKVGISREPRSNQTDRTL
jgi:hypothetical protein